MPGHDHALGNRISKKTQRWVQNSPRCAPGVNSALVHLLDEGRLLNPSGPHLIQNYAKVRVVTTTVHLEIHLALGTVPNRFPNLLWQTLGGSFLIAKINGSVSSHRNAYRVFAK